MLLKTRNTISRLIHFLVIKLRANNYIGNNNRMPAEQDLDDSEVVLLKDGEIFASITLNETTANTARVGIKADSDIKILRCSNNRLKDCEEFKDKLYSFHERINTEHNNLKQSKSA